MSPYIFETKVNFGQGENLPTEPDIIYRQIF